MKPVNQTSQAENVVEPILRHFALPGELLMAAPFGSGHINDTYRIQLIDPAGNPITQILQRINQNVFHRPEWVMENIEKITHHLREKIVLAGGDPQREVLNLIKTHAGGSFFQDDAGDVWRMFQFIHGARTYETVENPAHVVEVGAALGRFHAQLADFDASQLHETIPNFHHTPRRFAAFVDAVQRDAVQRAAGVQAEIQFILAREAQTAIVVDLLAQGILSMRVTHNDTKFNNVMVDDRTGKSICLIDLDTVMPGSVLYDFGDAVRSTASLSLEDEPDLRKAGFSLSIFEHLAQGYLDAARDFLTDAEKQHLAFAGVLITLEQAIRFLTDYLNGDTYYKIHRPEHNLERTRTQIKMVQEMEQQAHLMEAAIARCQS